MYEEPPHSKNIAAATTEELKITDADRKLNKDLKLS
jgi:hypothetical protein